MSVRCVAARKAEGFNVTDTCEAAGVSRSAFYAWQDRPEGPSEAEWDEAHLINQIVDIHRASSGTYGAPRITAELADKGEGIEGVHRSPPTSGKPALTCTNAVAASRVVRWRP